jgi:hypothetical protein
VQLQQLANGQQKPMRVPTVCVSCWLVNVTSTTTNAMIIIVLIVHHVQIELSSVITSAVSHRVSDVMEMTIVVTVAMKKTAILVETTLCTVTTTVVSH